MNTLHSVPYWCTNYLVLRYRFPEIVLLWVKQDPMRHKISSKGGYQHAYG